MTIKSITTDRNAYSNTLKPINKWQSIYRRLSDAAKKLIPARLPVYLQAEASECGLACLAMIASYYRYEIDLPTLRRRFSVSQSGINLFNLSQLGQSMNLECRALALELDQLTSLAMPCVLHWDMNHFVVLRSINHKQAIIHDPAFGKRIIPISKLSKSFTGIALEVRPGANFKPDKNIQKITLKPLIGKLVGVRRGIIQIALCGILLEALSLILPFQLQLLVDQSLPTNNQELAFKVGTAFLAIVFVHALINGLRDWFLSLLSNSINFQWFGNVFSHLLRLPVHYFHKRHVGQIVANFSSIKEIQRTLTNTFLESTLDGLMSIGILLVMIWYSPLLTMIALVPVIIYSTLRFLLYDRERSLAALAISQESKQTTHFLESISGIESIKLFNREETRKQSWLDLVAQQLSAEANTNRFRIIFENSNRAIFGFERVISVWIAIILVMENTFSLGMMMAFLAYREQFSNRIGKLIDAFYELKRLSIYSERVADITFNEKEVQLPPRAIDHEKLTISVTDLFYRYSDSDPWVLENINLTIESGEFVAITGASGCGKTTLFKIMLGLLKPTKGAVSINNTPIPHLGSSNYRELVGTVMQNDQLFGGSVLDNITYFEENPNIEQAKSAARLAAIDDEIEAMAMGYETLVGNGGATLSGGAVTTPLAGTRLIQKTEDFIFR